MAFLTLLGWFIFSCVLMSFIEHQVHARLMHKRTSAFKRAFEAHVIFHHKHYTGMFCDEPVGPGEDKEIRLTVMKAPIKALPVALIIAFFSWQGALIFIFVMVMHHWTWNQIHLEMHKPSQRIFTSWATYKFLARYHYLHHRYQDKNFNVVFPLADYILGTHARATAVDKKNMLELGY
jgi:Fatty acid hydroxylase superfamily